jgi:CheY-like chemotaxis protein
VSEGLIGGLAALASGLIVFFVLAWRFPDVIRDLARRLTHITIRIPLIVTISGAMAPAARAVEEKEGHRPDEGKLRADLEAIPRSSRVLWVDDHPENNELEIRALNRLGVQVETVASNEEAEQAVRRNSYDLIISDIGRDEPEEPKAGLELPRKLATVTAHPFPIVYYTGYAESPQTPDGYAVTDRPSELFSLIRSELSSDR